jgi:hypothetical protein
LINIIPPNKWSVISAVAAVAALLVPFFLYIIGHQSKDLSVATVSRAVLVNLSEGGSVTLTYNGTSVSHLTATTIEVRNDGTRPIERSDFERPLLIRFPKSSSILAATLGEKEPVDLQPTVSLEAGAITIAPLLLNPGDRFRVTAQLLGDFDEPAIEARISGIRAISRQPFRDLSVKSPRPFATTGVLATCGYFYLAGLISLSSRPPHARSVIFLPLADAFVMALILGVASAGSVVMILSDLNWSEARGRMIVLAIGTIGSAVGAALAWFRGRAPLVMRTSAPARNDSAT